MYKLSEASMAKLATCDNRLQEIIIPASQRVQIVVIEGHRGQVAQEAAFAAGKSQKHFPFGNHNSIPSKAVDIAPLVMVDKLTIDWGDFVAFGRLMGYIQRIADEKYIKLRFGLDWDGDWRTVGKDPGEHFLDAPHVELVDP